MLRAKLSKDFIVEWLEIAGYGKESGSGRHQPERRADRFIRPVLNRDHCGIDAEVAEHVK